MTTLFSGITPVRLLHVTVGTGTGNGSLQNPFHSVQAAVDAATPGTAIIVHAGIYNENVKINHQRSGTTAAPIWLVSGDGPQAASIVAPSADKPVIQALGVDNYVISGFNLRGGYDGIQFSQSGRDFTNLVNNVLIQGNVISNVAHDGIKVGQANNIQILDNKIYDVASEEGIDFVAVNNAVIARNEISNVKGTSAAIFAKGGSSDIKIIDNYVHDVRGDGISAGGNTTLTSFRPGVSGFEAKNVLIDGNRIEDVGKRPVSVRGAINVDITDNFLKGSSAYGTAVYITTGGQGTTRPVVSRDIFVAGNKLNSVKSPLTIDPGNNNTVVHTADLAGAWVNDAGADPLVLPGWAISAGKLLEPTKPVLAQSPIATLPTPTQSSPPTDAQAPSVSGLLPVSNARISAPAQNTIYGTSGKDALLGTDAADKLDGLSREDVMTGGKGDDTYIVSGYKDVVVEAVGGGTDTVELFDNRFWLPDNVENMIGRLTSGALLVGNNLDNRITGSVGDDVIVGRAGQDVLTGGGGSDRYILGYGDGSDVVTDFGLTDSIVLEGVRFSTFEQLRNAMVQNGNDVVLDLGGGQVLVLKGVQIGALTATQFAFDNLSKLASQSASPSTSVFGTKSVEKIEGGSGNDFVDGGGGGDVLIGAAGDDTYVIRSNLDRILESANGGTDTAHIYIANYSLAYQVENVVIKVNTGARVEGNAGANVIVGGDGNDTIISGGGNDLLSGGSGVDRFVVLSSDTGSDRITDFTTGEDKLDLSSLRQAYPGGAVVTARTVDGLQVFFDHSGHLDLVATLQGTAQISTFDLIL